jgi:hypothetical protein
MRRLASSCYPEIHLADTRSFWAGDAADQVQDQERLTVGAAAAERRLLAEETRERHADGNWPVTGEYVSGEQLQEPRARSTYGFGTPSGRLCE